MAKRFNITGTCIPERHYLGDISKKLDRIIEIVIQGDYFTINRPRQYGSSLKSGEEKVITSKESTSCVITWTVKMKPPDIY